MHFFHTNFNYYVKNFEQIMTNKMMLQDTKVFILYAQNLSLKMFSFG